MDAWKNAFFLQEKPMSIKFLVLGGGGILGFGGGGGEVPILFLWARGFSWFFAYRFILWSFFAYNEGGFLEGGTEGGFLEEGNEGGFLEGGRTLFLESTAP